MKYWRLTKCPHEWEEVATFNGGFDLVTTYQRLFCPHCGCHRKLRADKAIAVINAQEVSKRYGYID